MGGASGASFPPRERRDYRVQRSRAWGEKTVLRRMWKSVGTAVMECGRECRSKAGRQIAE